MRRPVKPFVTEYRGGSRRPSGQGSGPGLDLFKSEPASSAPSSSPSPWTPPVPPALNDQPEDGYEAALRAADALFSGAKTPVNAASAAPASPMPSASNGEAAKAAAPTSGRILRVIDEPPTAEMLELERLEAEHAPKKRGRKPGSKNKPKVTALVAEPQTATPPVVKAPAVADATLPAATVTAALAARAIATAPRRTESAAPNERYAWVRTRLKPGQQWKRRLPKVAW